MKKILLAAFAWPLLALAQSYPSPTFNNLTINGSLNAASIGLTNPLPVASGGTGRSTAAGSSLDNITGFSGTGFMSRTGAGAYSFTASTGSGNVVLATSPTISAPTISGTMNAGGTLLNIYGTNTGSPAAGLTYYSDSTWNPSGAAGQFNNYWQIHMPAVSLNGGTVQQRWNSSNQPLMIDLVTTGPTGTPSSPSGMADSHTIGIFSYETIPAGLCDGQNGSGFTGAGGSPGNNCYQEIGGVASVNTILSPGHYAEGIASTVNDNSGGTGVPIRGTAFLANISKNSATNTYNTYGYAANSIGTQQTTNAPTAAFVVQGGWQTSLDLSQNTNTGAAAIRMPNGGSINSDATNMYFGVNSVGALSLNSTSSTLTGGLTTTGAITPTGGIVASTTGTQPASSQVGYVQSNTTNSVALTANTATTITSTSLSAGNWDVQCVIQYNPASGTTATAYWDSVSATNNALSGQFASTSLLQIPTGTNTTQTMVSPIVPVSLASPATYYCVGQSSFGTSTMSANGYIRALRRP
jgi:hypothetical protein